MREAEHAHQCVRLIGRDQPVRFTSPLAEVQEEEGEQVPLRGVIPQAHLALHGARNISRDHVAGVRSVRALVSLTPDHPERFAVTLFVAVHLCLVSLWRP